MRILYHLQLSAVDRKTKKFLMDKDSNFNFFISMVKAMNEEAAMLKEEYKWCCLVPEESDMEYDELEFIDNVAYSKVKYCKDVFNSRYFWDVEEMKQEILIRKPDIIWENNPTLVNNWKTLLLEMGLIDKIKVANYNHWIDSNQYPKIDRRCAYQYRQVEAIMLSDLTLCNSDFAKEQLERSACYLLSESANDKCFDCIQPIPPMVDEVAIKEQQCEKNKKAIQIIYPHRLSSMNYYKDAFNKFIGILNHLKKVIKKDVVVVLTDASGKIKSRKEIPFEDNKYIKLVLKKNLNREKYYKELNKSHICVATFKEGNGGNWSMGLAEAIVAECAVVSVRHSGYKEMIPMQYTAADDNMIGPMLIRLIKDAVELKRNSWLCNEFYQKRYGHRVVAKKLDELLIKLEEDDGRKTRI